MRFDQLDLNYLVKLEVLLTEENLTRAAARLSLSQPALSNAINKLRAHFDDALLVRRGRLMVCTPFARELLPELRSALVRLRSVTFSKPSVDAKAARRQIMIAGSDYIAAVFITELVRRLDESAPKLNVIHVPINKEAELAFERGEIDAIIQPEGSSTCSQHPRSVLFSDQLVCLARKGNPLVGDELPSETYHALNRIVTPFGPPEPRIRPPQGAKLGRTVTLPLSAAPWLVARSDYVALVPERYAKLIESSLNVRRVRLSQTLARTDFIVQWHDQSVTDQVTLWLLDQMRDIGRGMDVPSSQKRDSASFAQSSRMIIGTSQAANGVHP